MKVTPHENFFAIQIHVYGCIGFQPLYICICIHTNVCPGEYRYVNVHVEVAPLRHEDRIYLTRCVQLFVSVGEMFWDCQPGHAVVQHVGKHSSTNQWWMRTLSRKLSGLRVTIPFPQRQAQLPILAFFPKVKGDKMQTEKMVQAKSCRWCINVGSLPGHCPPFYFLQCKIWELNNVHCILSGSRK